MSAEPVTLGSLARELHAQEGAPLAIALPPGAQVDVAGEPGVSIEGGELRFATLADRNRIVAADALRELGPDAAADPQHLFAMAYQLWRHEIGHGDDSACGRLLAAANTSADVLRLAAAAIEGRNVFRVLHAVEAMLPHMASLPAASLIALAEAQHGPAAGDGAGFMFFERLRGWLAGRAHLANELAVQLLEDPTEPRLMLLQASWLGWFGHDPDAAAASVVQASGRDRAALVACAFRVAGRMLEQPLITGEVAAALEAVLLRGLNGPAGDPRRTALSAATDLLPHRRAFDAALRAMAEARDAEALASIAGSLGHHVQPLTAAGQFYDWLALCRHLPAQYEMALGSLDHALAGLLRTDAHRDQVLNFLADWITTQGPDGLIDTRLPEIFDACAARIFGDSALLARVVTEWFMSDVPGLPAAATGLLSRVSRRGESTIGLDVAILDAAEDAALPFLARRLLGYLIDGGQLLSLALSLLRLRDAAHRVYPLMPWLLGQEIGYDYPDTTIQRLRGAAEAASDDAERQLLDGIRAGLEADMAALESLPRLKMLAPPAELRRGFRKARAKQMEAAMREGESRSVLRQIFQSVTIKAGTSFFQQLDDHYTEPTAMAAHSISMELPRREALDPIGNDYRRRVLRSTRRQAS